MDIKLIIAYLFLIMIWGAFLYLYVSFIKYLLKTKKITMSEIRRIMIYIILFCFSIFFSSKNKRGKYEK